MVAPELIARVSDSKQGGFSQPSSEHQLLLHVGPCTKLRKDASHNHDKVYRPVHPTAQGHVSQVCHRDVVRKGQGHKRRQEELPPEGGCTVVAFNPVQREEGGREEGEHPGGGGGRQANMGDAQGRHRQSLGSWCLAGGRRCRRHHHRSCRCQDQADGGIC